jgi:uncharacterized protein YbjT (DUF2867 family)
MAEKKIIAVVGATGAQGGGLVRAILNDSGGDFSARALTRRPTTDKAKALAERGAEVVAADLDDVESLKSAFEGAYGAFCVTSFWEHLSPERELVQARAMAQAAKHAGLFQFKRDFNDIYCGARNVEVARALNPALQTFDAWLAQNKSRIPLET